MKVIFNKFSSFIFLLLLLFSITSCDEEQLQNIVVTEDVLYLSGDVVRLTGRVIETNGTVDEHGFQIDDNPEFSSPEIISLGIKEEGLGRFIGEFDQLTISTNYYYRSYINVGGTEVTGQTEEFITLDPKIDSFTPTNGVQGKTVSIFGNNFTQDTQVKFGDQTVQIVSIVDESEIIVVVPPITDEFSVSVTVEVQDTIMSFTTLFDYHFGKWTLEDRFIDDRQFYETAWLKDGNDFIFGVGAPDKNSLNDKFWKLDLSTYTWTEIAYAGAGFGYSRQPFNAGLYWGSGDGNVDADFNQPTDTYWKYNNGVFEQQPGLPFQVIGGVAFILNDMIHIFGGLQSSLAINRNVFFFNDTFSSWDVANAAPIDITKDYPSFSHDNKAYFLQADGSLWRYDPSDVSWTVVSQFVDAVEKGGMATVLNGKAYIGLFENRRQVWEWDITNNTWFQKSIFNGTGVRDINQAAFTHDNKVFFFRTKFDGGIFDPDPKMELWSLDPNELK